jgi:hypothetical protein
MIRDRTCSINGEKFIPVLIMLHKEKPTTLNGMCFPQSRDPKAKV